MLGGAAMLELPEKSDHEEGADEAPDHQGGHERVDHQLRGVVHLAGDAVDPAWGVAVYGLGLRVKGWIAG